MSCSNFCAILQCRRIHRATWDKENGITYFGVPKDSFEKWKDIVPNLKKGDRLCTRHFDESDIIKGFLIGSVFHKNLRWHLKKGVYPKRLLLDSDYPEERRTIQQKKTINQYVTSNGNGQNNSTAIKKLFCGMEKFLNRDQPATVCPADIVPSSSIPLHQNDSFDQVPSNCDHDYALGTIRPNGPEKDRPVMTESLTQDQPVTVCPADIVPSSSIPLPPNDSFDQVQSNCDHDYSLGTAQPNVPEKDRPVMTESQAQEIQDASSAVHDFDHSYGVRPTSSTPTIEESCLDLNLAGYRDFILDVTFPTAEWSWSFNLEKKHLMCSSHCMSEDGVMTIKTLKFLSETKVQLFINGKPIIAPDLKLEFQRKADLSHLIEDLHFRRTCQGIVEESVADLKVMDKWVGSKEGNVWRSKECQGLTLTGVVCSKCRYLRRYSKKMSKRQPKELKDIKERCNKKLRTTRRALNRMKSKVENFSDTIAELRKEQRKLIWNGFDAKIKILNPKEQLVVKTMMAKAKARPGRDDKLTAMRYDPEFIADSLLIKQKSTAVYKHLRSKGILPLPSEATLLRAAKKNNVGGLNSGAQAGQIYPSSQPHQNPSDSDESIQPELDQSTPRQQLDENMENEHSDCPDFAVAMSPKIVSVEAEEMTVSISDEMIVEVHSIE